MFMFNARKFPGIFHVSFFLKSAAGFLWHACCSSSSPHKYGTK